MKNLLIILLLLSFISEARKSKSLDYASLEKNYNNLIYEEKYSPFAKNEKQIAKRSIEALINGKVKKQDRPLSIYIAKFNIAYARLVAEEEWIVEELDFEDEKATDYALATSKIEAKIARHDAEVARMMLIAQQEESQRSKDRADQAELMAQNSINQAELLRQETEAARRYAKAQAEEADLAKQEAELAMEEADSLRKKLDSISTEQTDKGLMMTLGDFMFDPGRVTIKREAINNFSKVIDFINTYPNNMVRIEGHTDSTGGNELNLKISQKRADAVKKLLIKNGISKSMIQAVGMGEELPIADNSTKAGKAKNRRVEIIILQ